MDTSGRKLILFDIDGTLLTCHGLAGKALVEALEEVFETIPSLDGYRYSGKTDPQIVHELMAANGHGREAISQNLPRVFERYLEILDATLRPESVDVLPGVGELLARLEARPDVAVGLLTGNHAGGAAIKLRAAGLSGYFRFGAFGSDHADRNLLVPIARRRALDELGDEFPGARTIIVGDAEADVRCARAGQARVVAVASGWTPRASLELVLPDALLDSLADPQALAVLLA